MLYTIHLIQQNIKGRYDMVVCFCCKLYLQAYANNAGLLKTSHKTMNLTEVARQQTS